MAFETDKNFPVRPFIIATGIAAALSLTAYALTRKSETSQELPKLETVAISEGSCDALRVHGPNDHRQTWERNRDAYLAGCPNIPPESE